MSKRLIQMSNHSSTNVSCRLGIRTLHSGIAKFLLQTANDDQAACQQEDTTTTCDGEE